MADLPRALIVAGPTTSGKSALALAIAQHAGGTIINTDSMQVYRELRVLTARPTPEEEKLVPHRLYGIRPAAEAGSVAWWRETALAAMEEARAAGRLPIRAPKLAPRPGGCRREKGPPPSPPAPPGPCRF